MDQIKIHLIDALICLALFIGAMLASHIIGWHAGREVFWSMTVLDLVLCAVMAAVIAIHEGALLVRDGWRWMRAQRRAGRSRPRRTTTARDPLALDPIAIDYLDHARPHISAPDPICQSDMPPAYVSPDIGDGPARPEQWDGARLAALPLTVEYCNRWLDRTGQLHEEGVAEPDVAAAREVGIAVESLRAWTLAITRHGLEQAHATAARGKPGKVILHIPPPVGSPARRVPVEAA